MRKFNTGRLFMMLLSASCIFAFTAIISFRTELFPIFLTFTLIFLATLITVIIFSWLEWPDCPLCGSKDCEVLLEKDRLGMVKCNICNLTYAKPRYAVPRRGLLCQFWSYKDVTDKQRIEGYRSDTNLNQNIKPKLKLIVG